MRLRHVASTEPLSQSKPAPIASINGRAQTKTAWKTMSITTAKTISPQTRCVSTRSMRSLAVTAKTSGSETTPSSIERAQA